MLQAFAVGRIGKDAEMHYTPEKTAVTNFSIAADQGWGDKKKTIWLDCTIWGKLAENLTKYLVKGTQVVVQGDLDVRAWHSQQDDDPHATIKISVQELTLCGSKMVPA